MTFDPGYATVQAHLPPVVLASCERKWLLLESPQLKEMVWMGTLGISCTRARTSSGRWSGRPSVRRYTASAPLTAVALVRTSSVLVLPPATRACTHCPTAARF